MALPLPMPFGPMEALSVDAIPVGEEWQYEPKWDGFRALAFRDGDKIEIQSKSGRLMTRYFPELVAALGALKARKFVLDGELVVPAGRAFSFDALLQRIHPAASRVRRLAAETPVLFIIFDLLVGADGRALTGKPLVERRRELESFYKKYCRGSPRLRLSPATMRLADAERWLKRVGATLDGVVAKRRDLPYRSGDRSGMQKIKNYRSTDCVVGGFRYNEGSALVGSLLLGLYDEDGLLHHVGFTSTIKREDKPALTKKLKVLIAPPGFTGNAPGGPSRWSTERSGEWQPLKPKLVVEVCYDHFSGGRFRHGTRLIRWRPDKAPRQCTLDQVKQKKANTGAPPAEKYWARWFGAVVNGLPAQRLSRILPPGRDLSHTSPRHAPGLFLLPCRRYETRPLPLRRRPQPRAGARAKG
jgi:ATP-dependent DNA ligase